MGTTSSEALDTNPRLPMVTTPAGVRGPYTWTVTMSAALAALEHAAAEENHSAVGGRMNGALVWSHDRTAWRDAIVAAVARQRAALTLTPCLCLAPEDGEDGVTCERCKELAR